MKKKVVEVNQSDKAYVTMQVEVYDDEDNYLFTEVIPTCSYSTVEAEANTTINKQVDNKINERIKRNKSVALVAANKLLNVVAPVTEDAAAPPGDGS